MRSVPSGMAALALLFGSALAALPPQPPSADAPAGVVIDHKEATCIVAERPSRFEACATAPKGLSRMRLNFRAEGGPFWYFVEMQPEAGCHLGILPAPQESTKRVDYYLDALDVAFAESRTVEYHPIVVERESECKDRLMAAWWSGTTPLVVGAAPGAPPIPPGFLPGGIVAAAGGGGISALTWGLIGGGAALGVVAVGAAGGDEDTESGHDPQDQDQDRDGYSSRQGDCNDNNAAVNPAGVLQLANARFETPTTTCPDGTADSQLRMPILVDASNNSCSEATVNSISATLAIATVWGQVIGYSPGQTFSFSNLLASATRVASGHSATLRVEPVLTCTNWCGTGYMETSGTLTIATSAGTFTVQTAGVNHTDYPVRP